MVSLDGLYALRHIQDSNGQLIENTYFFSHAAGTGNATQLCLDFESEWLPSILALQVADLVTQGITAYNMGDTGTLPAYRYCHRGLMATYHASRSSPPLDTA